MKFKIRFYLGLVFLLGFLLPAEAQNLQVQGKVTNKATGEALAGATVLVKGTNTTTVTTPTGNFSIAVPKGKMLVVSFVGMASIEQVIQAGGMQNFAMETGAAVLNDVVVVGYGTQKITKVSGAISTIKSADIEKVNAVRVEEAIQGRAAGVNVIQGGSPGTTPTVLIRGIPSFSGTDPTVIIDGVQQTLTDFNSINAADVESINILKDAATTAIYGVKGGNGVIVVTTKSGRGSRLIRIGVGLVVWLLLPAEPS